MALIARENGLLGMNGDTWAQLWSGFIGAIAGSAAAAVVAGYVLKETLAEQRRLAADAQASQSKLAHWQLEAQRNALDKQLDEQKIGLGRQLTEQRAEASKARGIEAISALIAEIDQVVTDTQHGVVFTPGELSDLRLRLSAATSRWAMEIDNGRMEDEVQQWPSLIFRLTKATVESSGDSRASWSVLLHASTALRTRSMAWYKTDFTGQDELAVGLKDARLHFDPLLRKGDVQYESAVASMIASARQEAEAVTENELNSEEK